MPARSWKCKARPNPRPSIALSWTRCSRSPRAASVNFSSTSALRSPFMPVDREQLEALATEIGRFYVRDKPLRRAQVALERALAEGDPAPRIVEDYLKAA